MGERPAVTAIFVAVAVLFGATAAVAGPPRERYRTADEAAARGIVLRTSDLPTGWKLELSPRGVAIPFVVPCSGYNPDLHRLTETGTSVGIAVVSGRAVRPVRSLTVVFATASDAKTTYRALSSPAYRRCLRQDGGSKTTAKEITDALPSASVYWLRLTAPIRVANRNVVLVADYVSAQRGRAFGLVVFEGDPGQPPLLGYEHALISHIATRMATAKL
jgi:hypothetical protein